MIIDRVNFNDDSVRSMSREDFVGMHVGVLWQDRDEDTRKKMLSDVYDRITGMEKPRRQKTEK